MDISGIIASAPRADKIKLTVHHNAVVKCTKAYQDDPSSTRLRDLRAAEQALSQEIERVSGGNTDKADRFSSRREALAWILGQGCKVSKTKFYDDCAAGLIVVGPDKSVSKWQVSQYLLKLMQESVPQASALDYQEKREKLELRRLQLDVDEREIKTRKADGEWMRTEDAWSAVAAMLAALKDNLQYQFYQGQTLLVHLAAGDPVREPEVYEECLAIVGRAYNDLAGSAITGFFATEDQEHGEGEHGQE